MAYDGNYFNIFSVSGFPIAVGYPHMYLADPSVRDAVEGFYPDPKIHKTEFLIEPVSE